MKKYEISVSEDVKLLQSWIPIENYTGQFPPDKDKRANISSSSIPTVLQFTAAIQGYVKFFTTEQAKRSFGELRSELDQWKTKFKEKLQTEADELDRLYNKTSQESEAAKDNVVSAVTELIAQSKNQPLTSFLYMLIAFVFSLLALHLVIRWFPSETANRVFSSGYLLQIFTVFVLISSIVILAIANVLQGEQLSTLIAAISGYVLGQLGRTGAPQAPSTTPPATSAATAPPPGD